MEIAVTNVYPCDRRRKNKTYLANWKATIGPFKIWNGALVRFDDDAMRLEFGGRQECGISMERDTELEADLLNAVISAWMASTLEGYMGGC